MKGIPNYNDYKATSDFEGFEAFEPDVKKIHKIIIDSVGYPEKPTGSAIGAITNRMTHHASELAKNYTIEEIAAAIAEGKTTIFTSFDEDATDGQTFAKNDHAQETPLIMLDIDNKLKRNGQTLTFKSLNIQEIMYSDILSRCQEMGLSPAIIYETFSSGGTDSNGNTFNNYRVIFQLDKPIPASEKETTRQQVYEILMQLFNKEYNTIDETETTSKNGKTVKKCKLIEPIDKSCIDAGRLSFGTNGKEKILHIDNNAIITISDILKYKDEADTIKERKAKIVSDARAKDKPQQQEQQASKQDFTSTSENSWIDDIKSRYAEYMTPDKSGKGFVCPRCGSGTGEKGTGLRLDGKSSFCFNCFACGWYGDVINYIAEKNNIENKEAIEMLKNNNTAATTSTEASLTDYSNFMTACKNALKNENSEGIRYLTARGFTNKQQLLKLCEVNKIGYNEKNNSLIIPLTKYSYKERFISDDAANKYKFTKQEKQPLLYNYWKIKAETKTIFVTEGELNALAIEYIDSNYTAVAVGTAANAKKAGETLEKYVKQAGCQTINFVLCPDNDKTGKNLMEQVATALQEKGYNYIISDIYDSSEEKSDINDLLKKDAAQLKSLLSDAVTKVNNLCRQNNMLLHIDNLLNKFENDDIPVIKTGFNTFDRYTGGIAYGELTLIGASPSLGKTTLVMQMAENMLQLYPEIEVLCFSLEMTKAQHLTRSLSRLTHELTPAGTSRNEAHLLTSKDIAWNRIPDESREHFTRCINKYKEYAERLHIINGERRISKIEKTIETFVNNTKKIPLVIIDYVQLIKTDKNNASTIDIIQETIAKLSNLKEKYNLPIIAINALNRESYKDGAKITLASGRDTSDLEYSADTQIALNFTEWEEGTDYPTPRETLISEIPRAITVKILKNRMGEPAGFIPFIYRPHVNHFEELKNNRAEFTADEISYKLNNIPTKLTNTIATLKKIKDQLIKGEIPLYRDEAARRYTKKNANDLNDRIEVLQKRLDKIKEEMEKKEKKAATKKNKNNVTLSELLGNS